MSIYGLVGTSEQQLGGMKPKGWIELPFERPEGNWIVSEQGTWVELDLNEVATTIQLTKREFLKIVLALTKDTPTPISLTMIENYVKVAPDYIRLEWDYATFIERNHPALDGVANDFGITPEMLDYIFVYSKELLQKIDNGESLHET